MSSHADTIRATLQSLGLVRYGRFERPQAQEGLDALDALLAENQQLRDALDRGKRFERCYQESLGAVWTRPMQERLDSLQAAFLDSYVEALAGDAE